MLLVTPVFPTMTGQNICCDKGLLKMETLFTYRKTSDWSVRLGKPLAGESPVSVVLFNVHY